MTRPAPVVLFVILALSAATPAGAAETLPGAPAHPEPLRSRLEQALAARGDDYVPRTRHRREDGSPRFSNRLLLESSPYLQQHAHNPVDWYPWGDEAFEAARHLGRPVLLSIGYSTCHWCHVMEEESFEDLEIAVYLNAHYIAVKVDREERPDLDAVYMSAVQLIAGRGGWPMTTWLTPQGEPFFGGTYFPARDGDRGARRGFLTLLRELRSIYDAEPERVAQQAERIVARLRAAMRPEAADALPGLDLLDRAAVLYAARFDPTHGGLRGAPKFPSSLPVRLMLRLGARTGDGHYRAMAELTLDRMAAGGMYDQVGGGFHRYSTDERWLVPHFEKMLYDNALLTLAYLDGYQATGNADYRRVVEETLRYVTREMTSPRGAFYSATDADSLDPEGQAEEGWFFTWTPAELRAALGERLALRVAERYGVSETGNFEGRSILHRARPEGDEPAELRQARERLYRIRSSRPAPLRDEKILTSWNALMISAFARAGFVLDRPDLVRNAERAARFLLDNLRDEDGLLRTYHQGRARQPAFLEDHVFLVAAMLDLYEASFDVEWIRRAVALQRTTERLFADEGHGGFYRTGARHEALLARETPDHDGAQPSGNSIALMNLLRLHEFTGRDSYRRSADALLRAFAPALSRSPTALSEMLGALEFRLGQPLEIVIVTPASREEAEPFLAALRKLYLPDRVLVVAAQGKDLETQAKLLPLLERRVAREGKTTAYVCRQRVCQLPTNEVEQFSAQLRNAVKPRAKSPDPIDSPLKSR